MFAYFYSTLHTSIPENINHDYSHFLLVLFECFGVGGAVSFDANIYFIIFMEKKHS